MSIAVVKHAEGSAYGLAGPASVSPGNSQGNLLVVLAGWDVAAQQTSGSPVVPAAAVADDQRNRWRLLADSGSQVSGARCAIWACSNALPVTSWLSVCPQGNFSSLWFTVAELSGLPAGYWPLADFTVAASAQSGTSLSLSPVAAQADLCLTIFAIGTTGRTLTGPGAGWTSIASGSVGGANPDGLITGTAWQAASAGTVAATWTASSSVPGMAMCSLGITQASFPPAQPNADFPLVLTEAAFGAEAGDPSQALLDTQWTDLSQYAIDAQGNASISATRGRQYELAQPESGTLAVRLNNLTGAFSPQNTGSPFYSNALNANMAFASAVTPWSARNAFGTVAWAASPAYSSAPAGIAAGSMQVTPNGGGANPGAVSEHVAASQNSSYTASCWLDCPAGWTPGAAVNITWYNSGGSVISTASGTAVPLPAGTWTMASVTGAAPAGTAAAQVTVYLSGTPASANVTYAAEAALARGASVAQTGLVRLGTPVRVTAWWNGRCYPVAWGLVERWPQDWPDFPQWGWTGLVATDIAGAAAVNLPSALQGELLADNPYACFPLSEQYTTSDNTVNGVVKTAADCDGQTAVNTALASQRPAVYTDGNTAMQTGLSMPFLGDSGTGAGTTYGAFDLSGDRGAGVQYGPDMTLPSLAPSGAGDVTLEIWTQVPTGVTLPAGPVTVQLWEVLVNPDLASNGVNNLAQGCLIGGGLYYPASGDIEMYWQPNWTATFYGLGPLAQGQLCQTGFALQAGSMYTLLNGGMSGANTGAVTTADLYALAFGLATSVTGSRGPNDGNYSFTVAYATLWPYRLSPARLAAHYAAGTTGFSGDTVLQRAGRYVAWARVNVGLAGPVVAETPRLGPSYGTAGTQMSAALNADATSAGSRWGGSAAGNLVVLARTAGYNQAATIAFGDHPAGPLNGNPDFRAGTTSWTGGNNGTIAGAAPPGGLGQFALQLTPDGITAGTRLHPENRAGSTQVAATPGQSYLAGTWVQAPAGYAAGGYMGVDWYTSGNTLISTSSSPSAQLAAGAWAYTELLATAPGTAAYGIWYWEAGGTPAAADVFLFSRFTIVNALDQVPYEPGAGFDYDNTYVSNSTQATLVSGPNTLAAPLVTSPASEAKYLQRGPLAQQVSGQTTGDAYDRATWSLSAYAEPSMRARALAVSAADRPASFWAVLRADISDPATVTRQPLGAPPYSLPTVIEQVELSIGPGTWDVTYQQSPAAPSNAVLVAGTGTSSVLGSNALAW
jgi:hypothetical protein